LATELKISPTDATLGASITGVSLSAVDDKSWSAIEEAFHEYAVLIFPGQHLSAEAQVAFGKRFGAIEYLVADKEIVPISNRREDGSLYEDQEHRAQILRGNEAWHTDSSYMRLAAKASILSAHVTASADGQTEWADMCAAYDTLDQTIKERIAGLSAYHSLYYSQAKIGHQAALGASYGFHNENPPLRPLVKVHPVTGRPALYIGRHAYGIPGLSPEESEKLLYDLVTFACQPPRTYRHDWQVGDAVIWDNRCVLHRARPYDRRESRVMMHTRIAGDPASEMAPAA
jgi:alpha-ketoglutarate-dependent taurine dioxygenase